MNNFKRKIILAGTVTALVIPILTATNIAFALEVKQNTVTQEETPNLLDFTNTARSGEAHIILLNSDNQEIDAEGNLILPPPSHAEPAGEAILEPPASSQPTAQLASAQGATLIEAAESQLGQGQDCTALVERALRAIGVNVGDVGPMGFASLGTQVSADQAQAGDIMMRNGHVAIYLGDNMAVHGGYNGTTVNAPANPYEYAVIVRL